jgi:hypothetical protein
MGKKKWFKVTLKPAKKKEAQKKRLVEQRLTTSG